MDAETLALEGLDQFAQELVEAETAPAVFQILLKAMPLTTPAGAVFLIRKGQLKGWNSFGYDEETAQRQRAFSMDSSAQPDFGQPAPSESKELTVTVKGRPIALLLAERPREAEPWFPHVLNLLVHVAQLRLELTLVAKKLAGAGETASAPVVAAQPAVPAGVPESSGLSPADDETPAAASAGPELEAAGRFARLVATDIRLYNEESVVLGRRNGDLADRLGDQLTRGKDTFMRRHGDLGPTGLRILHEAYVQVLAGGEGSLLPASVVE